MGKKSEVRPAVLRGSVSSEKMRQIPEAMRDLSVQVQLTVSLAEKLVGRLAPATHPFVGLGDMNKEPHEVCPVAADIRHAVSMLDYANKAFSELDNNVQL